MFPVKDKDKGGDKHNGGHDECDHDTTQPPLRNLTETLSSHGGEYNVLLNVFQESGSVDVIMGREEFTLFAPNDDAFARLMPDEIPEGQDLIDLLLYHSLATPQSTMDLSDMSFLRTLNHRAGVSSIAVNRRGPDPLQYYVNGVPLF